MDFHTSDHAHAHAHFVMRAALESTDSTRATLSSLVLNSTVIIACLAVLCRWMTSGVAAPAGDWSYRTIPHGQALSSLPSSPSLSTIPVPSSCPRQHSVSSRGRSHPSSAKAVVGSSRRERKRERGHRAMIEKQSQRDLDAVCEAMSSLSLKRKGPQKTVRFAEELNEVRPVSYWIWKVDIEHRLGLHDIHKKTSPRVVHAKARNLVPAGGLALEERDGDGDVVMSG